MPPDKCKGEAAAEGPVLLAGPGSGATQVQSSGLNNAFGGSTDVKVVVRVRPPGPGDREASPGPSTACVEVDSHNSLTVRQANAAAAAEAAAANAAGSTSSSDAAQRRTFSWVAGPATTQAEFFKVVGSPAVEHCLSGLNTTIITYGQPGSGKTHTLLGELPADGTEALPAQAGLIPRVLKCLWQRMPEVQDSLLAAAGSGGGSGGGSSSRSSSWPRLSWLVRCSMIGVQRDGLLHDLLNPGRQHLALRHQHVNQGWTVEGCEEVVVDNVSNVVALIRAGLANQHAASTAAAAQLPSEVTGEQACLAPCPTSSHCIFSCSVESQLQHPAASAGASSAANIRSSRLLFVDLAGVDSTSSSSSSGGGEGVGDAGLDALQRVVAAVAAGQPDAPYQDSSLTKLLQGSLGGNCKAVVIANVSPSGADLAATNTTLDFASRARWIVNTAVVNEDHRDETTLLHDKLRRLQQEVSLARALAATPSGLAPATSSTCTDSGMAAAAAGGDQQNQQNQQHQQQQSAAAGGVLAHQQQQHHEQQQHLSQVLQLMSELGERNCQLEAALDFCQRERSELERSCLESRQELAAMHVSLQQAQKENKSWRHRWFKPDKAGKTEQQQQQQRQLARSSRSLSPIRDSSPVAAAAAAAKPSTPGSATPASLSATAAGAMQPCAQQQQQQPPAAAAPTGWRAMFSVKRQASTSPSPRHHAAPAAVAATADGSSIEAATAGAGGPGEGPQEEAAAVTVLQLVARQLAALVTADGDAAAADEAELRSRGPADGSTPQLLQSKALQELQQLQDKQQHQHGQLLPELPTIITHLQHLAAWQPKQGSHHIAQQQQQQLGAPPAAPDHHQQHQQQPQRQQQPSSPTRGKVVVAPSELHRQLLEERQVSVQLQAQVRKLQQELVMAGGPSVAAMVHMPSSSGGGSGGPGRRSGSPLRVCQAGRGLPRASPAVVGAAMHLSADAAWQGCMVGSFHGSPRALGPAFDRAASEAGAAAVSGTAAAGSSGGSNGDGGSCLAAAAAEAVVVQVRIVVDEQGKVQNADDEGAAGSDAGVAQAPAGYELEQQGSQQQQEQQRGDSTASVCHSQSQSQSCLQEQQLKHLQQLEQRLQQQQLEQQQKDLELAALRAELADVQEQLGSLQRDRNVLHTRLQSARNVLAAARCSTPVSLSSSGSGLPSPRPSFSPLPPVFGESIDEEPDGVLHSDGSHGDQPGSSTSNSGASSEDDQDCGAHEGCAPAFAPSQRLLLPASWQQQQPSTASMPLASSGAAAQGGHGTCVSNSTAAAAAAAAGAVAGSPGGDVGCSLDLPGPSGVCSSPERSSCVLRPRSTDTEASLATAGSRVFDEELMSSAEVWHHHHRQWRHQQQQHNDREQLTKAVHAAIAGQSRSPGDRPASPAIAAVQQRQQVVTRLSQQPLMQQQQQLQQAEQGGEWQGSGMKHLSQSWPQLPLHPVLEAEGSQHSSVAAAAAEAAAAASSLQASMEQLLQQMGQQQLQQQPRSASASPARLSVIQLSPGAAAAAAAGGGGGVASENGRDGGSSKGSSRRICGAPTALISTEDSSLCMRGASCRSSSDDGAVDADISSDSGTGADSDSDGSAGSGGNGYDADLAATAAAAATRFPPLAFMAAAVLTREQLQAAAAALAAGADAGAAAAAAAATISAVSTRSVDASTDGTASSSAPTREASHVTLATIPTAATMGEGSLSALSHIEEEEDHQQQHQQQQLQAQPQLAHALAMHHGEAGNPLQEHHKQHEEPQPQQQLVSSPLQDGQVAQNPSPDQQQPGQGVQLDVGQRSGQQQEPECGSKQEGVALEPQEALPGQQLCVGDRWPSGPVWGVDDYEEEVRQLSEQLQELMANNSGLKALLQQRETELAVQQERLVTQADRLEQQDQELACAEEMLQELQVRLAATAVAAAAGLAGGDSSGGSLTQEPSDDQWAIGQVVGLMELNTMLQEQLEDSGRELEARAQEIQHLKQQQAAALVCGSTAAEAVAAAAAADGSCGSTTGQPVHALQPLLEWHAQQQIPASAGPTSDTRGEVHDQQSPSGAAVAADAVAAGLLGSAARGVPASPDVRGPRPGSRSPPSPAAAAAAGGSGASSGAEDGPAQSGADQRCCRTARSLAAAAGAAQADAAATAATAAAAAAAAAAEADGGGGAPASVSPTRRRRAACTLSRNGSSISPRSPSAGATAGGSTAKPHRWQPLSPFKKLRMQTQQLRAQPHNTQIAAEQAVLLQQQLARIGLQLQQSQLEAQLADVRAKLEGLKHQECPQKQQQQQHQQCMTPGAPCSPADSAAMMPSPWRDGASGRASPDSCWSLGQQSEHSHWPPGPQQQQQQQQPERRGDAAGGSSRLAVSSGPSQQPAAAAAAAAEVDIESAPAAADDDDRGGGPAAISTDGCADAAAAAATDAGSAAAASSESSTPRSSTSSDGLSSCEDMLTDLFQELQAMAAASHQASSFRAASASTLTPCNSLAVQEQQQHRRQAPPAAAAAVCDTEPCQPKAVTVGSSVPAADAAGAEALAFTCSQQQQQQQQLGTEDETACDGHAAPPAPPGSAPAMHSQQPGQHGHHGPEDAAARLQSDLQVASAFELAATRGLLHAGHVIQQLKSTLAGSKGGSGSKSSSPAGRAQACAAGGSSRRRSGVKRPPLQAERGLHGSSRKKQQQPTAEDPLQQQQQQQQQQASPSVVRVLFDEGDGADMWLPPPPLQLQQQSQQQPTTAAGQSVTAAAADGSNVHQQLDANVFLQVQQQQQHATDSLQRLKAAVQGSAAGGDQHLQEQVSELLIAQQQLQSMLQGTCAATLSHSASMQADQQLVVQQHGSDEGASLQPASCGGNDSMSRQGQEVQADVDQRQEVVQLQGQVISLQLELQQLKAQQQQANAALHNSTSCTSGLAQDTNSLRGSSDGGRVSRGPIAATAVVAAAVVAGERRGVSASPSGRMLLLSNKVRDLQATTLQQSSLICHLENEICKQELQLKQQALQAAAAVHTPGTGGAAGLLTPRGTLGSLTPHRDAAAGMQLCSPRMAGLFSPTRSGRMTSPSRPTTGRGNGPMISAVTATAAGLQHYTGSSRFAAELAASGGVGCSGGSGTIMRLAGPFEQLASTDQCRPLTDLGQRHRPAARGAAAAGGSSSRGHKACASTRGIRIVRGRPPLRVAGLSSPSAPQ